MWFMLIASMLWNDKHTKKIKKQIDQKYLFELVRLWSDINDSWNKRNFSSREGQPLLNKQLEKTGVI